MPDGLGLEQVIQEKCSRCHMGMARYQQLADGDTKKDIYVLGAGYLDPAHYLHEAAMDGVSCTLCHQVQKDFLGTPDSFTGQYFIDTLTLPPDRLIFGPYNRPRQNPMQQNTGFLPVRGNQLTDSAHCGSCHTLYTPALDGDGNYLYEFPEQMTYLEWEHSGSTVTCQDCHLPDAVGGVKISNRPVNLPRRSPFGQHHYVGGNTFMVNLLNVNADTLGVTAEPGHLDDTFNRTLDQLDQQTATLNATATLDNGTLSVVVEVSNLAGHKLPSGLPSRRSWLHVRVTNEQGNPVFESGKPLAEGKIQGNDAEDTNPNTYEWHYDTITSEEQVQIYEPIMLNSDGEVTHTLLRAASYAKDNRLLPAGFDKNPANPPSYMPDIAVYGEAANDMNFTGGTDQVTYNIDVGTNELLSITVKLWYQTLSFPFVEDLRNNDALELVGNFFGMYDQETNDPVALDVIEISVR